MKGLLRDLTLSTAGSVIGAGLVSLGLGSVLGVLALATDASPGWWRVASGLFFAIGIPLGIWVADHGVSDRLIDKPSASMRWMNAGRAIVNASLVLSAAALVGSFVLPHR